MKKLLRISILILLSLILFTSNILAVNLNSKNVSMELVEENVCKLNITDYSEFEKKLINFDENKKELSIKLTVSNNAILPLDKPSEIVLVIDNSRSMAETISTGGTRMEAVANSAKVLARKLLELDTVKVGVVSFSSFGLSEDNTNSQEGQITDAKFRTALSRDEQAIMNAIDAVAEDATGIRTNIEAGITLASQQFSGNCESQFIILLTDGVPNLSIGTNKIEYSGNTAINTRRALLGLSSKNIQLLSMMTGVTNAIAVGTTTYKELAEEVFGTPNNPTYGKFYYITDDEIETTISGSILTQLIAPKDDVLTNLDIYDYFPQEIVDNFDLEYVEKPNIGTVSEDIDLQNNCIVWHIDELNYNTSASLTYKLKLKENVQSEVIDKILNTNDGVVIDVDGSEPIISQVTSKIKLKAIKDDTPAPKPIPQTGMTNTYFTVLVTTLATCAILGILIYSISKEYKI